MVITAGALAGLLDLDGARAAVRADARTGELLEAAGRMDGAAHDLARRGLAAVAPHDPGTGTLALVLAVGTQALHLVSDGRAAVGVVVHRDGADARTVRGAVEVVLWGPPVPAPRGSALGFAGGPARDGPALSRISGFGGAAAAPEHLGGGFPLPRSPGEGPGQARAGRPSRTHRTGPGPAALPRRLPAPAPLPPAGAVTSGLPRRTWARDLDVMRRILVGLQRMR